MILSATTSLTETTQPPQCHINDDIEGVTMPVDEWIAKELARIKEKQEPRHCHDYEALIEVIEEISRMPTSMMMTMKQQNYNADTTIIVDNDSALTLPCVNSLEQSSMLLLLPSPPVSPITSSSMMVFLGRAFISLWKYCWDDRYAPHHPYPVCLLLDIEKIALLLYSNSSINNDSSNNNNNTTKNDNMMNNLDNDDPSSFSEKTQTIFSRKKKIASMQGIIQAQLSKAFYFKIPTPPPDTTTSCLLWLSSFQVIQQWISPLCIPEASSPNTSSDIAIMGWYTSLITGMDAYRSAKLSLAPLFSNFPHPSFTIDHLEQLMQKTHI